MTKIELILKTVISPALYLSRYELLFIAFNVPGAFSLSTEPVANVTQWAIVGSNC